MWTREVSESLEPALEHAQKAQSLDDSLPIVHTALSQSYQWHNQPDEALEAAEHAVALDPNNADALGGLAEILAMRGRPQEGVELIEKAIELNPHFPAWYLTISAWARFWQRNYDEALSLIRRANVRNPDMLGNHILLALFHARNGSLEQAAHAIEECKRVSGADVNISQMVRDVPFLQRDDLDHFIDAARVAGFPE